MKIKSFLLFIVLYSNYCLSQLKVTTGEDIFISGSDFLFTGDGIVNDGSITLGTGKLYVAGNIVNNGTLTLSNGTLSIIGNNTQIFDFGFLNITKRLELNKSSGTATINSGQLAITDGLLSTQGTIDGGEKLIMISSATKTAIVEQSTSGIINNIVVERYIPGKRAFRLLSSPVTASTSILYNWQENQHNTSTLYTNNLNTAPGYGTHITGSTTGSNGFDASVTGNPSLFTFNNTTQAWSAIANTTDTNVLNAGNPFRLMVRGNRSLDLSSYTPLLSNTVLRTRGTLKIGTYTNSNLSQISNGYNFIGNPYQTPVDMNQVITNSTNLNSNFYYVWDPKIGGLNGRGAYVTYTFSGNANNVAGSEVNQYLQPMQACFVKTLVNGPAQITFNESNKYTVATNENVYKNTNTNTASLRLTLYESSAYSQLQTPVDGTLLFFDDANLDIVDFNDANKMTNLDESLSVLVDNTKLSIGNFKYPLENTVYPLTIDQYRYTNYTIVASLNNYNGLTPYIHDKFTQTFTEINPTVNYTFSVDTTNPLSSANNRFELVYSTSILGNTDFNTESISLYPNPSTGNEFNLQLPSNPSGFEVLVYNNLGQLIALKSSEIDTNTLNLKSNTALSTGVYQVVIKNDTTKIVKKWIKQ